MVYLMPYLQHTAPLDAESTTALFVEFINGLRPERAQRQNRDTAMPGSLFAQLTPSPDPI